jgi:hypothetical protein
MLPTEDRKTRNSTNTEINKYDDLFSFLDDVEKAHFDTMDCYNQNQ